LLFASIPANIAEGCGRSGEAELARFMLISMGSASELEYHLLLAGDLGYLSAQHYQELFQEAGEVKRMLSAFITKLRHSKKLTS
jgi:four helix bundle protein